MSIYGSGTAGTLTAFSSDSGTSVGFQGFYRPKPDFAIPLLPQSWHREKREILQKWEGTVLVIDKKAEEFCALLVDKTHPEYPDEEVTLSFDEVSPSDLGLLQQGAVFYWSIDYIYQGGEKTKGSRLTFRRLKPFDPATIKRARAYGASLEALFDDDNQ